MTPSIANALKVFETINDQGVGLNAMDLLKNLLFIKTPSGDYPKLKIRWKELIDTLDKCNEKPLRFLRYYIMSHHEIDFHQGLQEDQIYEWFVENAEACGINSQPLDFTDCLIQCAKANSNFLSGKDINGQENRYLRNIKLLGGALRQQFILLLAGQHLSSDLFGQLCSAIENLFFCYIITRESTKTFERNFARWSDELRKVKDETGLNLFLDKYFVKDLIERKERFDFSFKELSQGRIQKYRMRYILAKLTQYIEEMAWGNPGHKQLDLYITKNVEIEHILPQTPLPEVKDAFDKSDEYDEYVDRLGNLTLLEKTINASIGREKYTNKKPGYKQSSFLLTKSLAEKPKQGTHTQLNKAVENLIQFNIWDSKAIEERQEMLTSLARIVWKMPTSSLENHK